MEERGWMPAAHIHPSPVDGRNNLAFPLAEVKIVRLEAAVAALYLLEQAALGAFLVAKDFLGIDIVGKDREEKAVRAVFAEKIEAVEI